jgi:hypothetical protein
MDTPAPTNFPEIDNSLFLDYDGTTLYQSYIGIIRWAIELGRIDLAHFGSTMANFSMAPREGDLTAVVRAFAYVKRHIQSRIVTYPRIRDFEQLDWTSKDWKRFYPDLDGETMPPHMQDPCGKAVQLTMFCDASHASDLVTH